MHNPPYNHVLGIPATRWQEGPFKIFAILNRRKCKYKIACKECKATSKGEVFLMRTISNKIKELKPCQH